MMRKLSVFIQVLFLCIAPVVAPMAMEEGRNTALALIADKSAVVPGEEITLSVETDIREHWHVYWENPGDSGEKLSLTWDLPKGFEAGDIQWPVPKRLPYGPLLNFGYEDHASFLVHVKAPKKIPAKEVTLKARAEILVCEEICIPEFEDLSLTLPVAQAAASANESVFKEARSHLPMKVETNATFHQENGQFVFNANLFGFKPVAMFPAEWGLIDNAADQDVKNERDAATVTVKRGDRNMDKLETVRFVLVNDKGQGTEVVATQGAPILQPEGAPDSAAPEKSESGIGVAQAFLFAILGGLLLNLMPCVFPVLSMKTLALVQLNEQERTHSQKAALAYTAGILVSFAIFAVGLLALRGAGEAVGWGFQLQSPVIVTLLAWVTAAIGFNLLGLFDVRGFGNLGAKLANGTGLTASFFTGVLAAIVATPCSAPFMAGALGAALTQPPVVATAIILALGFGLALPFLIISFVPSVARHLPRPGAWMEHFRQFLAFPMFAASVWLVWVAAGQIGADSIWIVLGGWLVIGLLIWIGRFLPNLWTRLFTLAFWLALVGLLVALPMAEAPQRAEPHHVFSEEVLKDAVAEKRPVFVYMTAKWCVTCLLNERVAIDTPETQKMFADTNTLVLKGDWTNYDQAITDYLTKHGRQGVPLYVLYNEGRETVLPQLLTPAIVADAYKREDKQ